MAVKKQKQVISGATADENGNRVAEDGGIVTPELEKIYQHDQEQKEQNTKIQVVPREKSAALANPTDTAVITNMFDVPKLCYYCYLQDKCQHFEPNADCFYQVNININSASDLANLVKMIIEKQGERVIFGRLIEQTEGGYIDRNLSEEMDRLVEMIKQFKDLMSAPSEEISVKIKGTEAVKSATGGSILNDLFKK